MPILGCLSGDHPSEYPSRTLSVGHQEKHCQENPWKQKPFLSPDCSCHGDSWGQLRTQHNCPLIWRRCILMGQITGPNLIVFLIFITGEKTVDRPSGILSHIPRNEHQPRQGHVQDLVASIHLSDTIWIFSCLPAVQESSSSPCVTRKKSLLFLLIALPLPYLWYFSAWLTLYFQDTDTNKSLFLISMATCCTQVCWENNPQVHDVGGIWVGEMAPQAGSSGTWVRLLGNAGF